jgi:hypothetical protein
MGLAFFALLCGERVPSQRVVSVFAADDGERDGTRRRSETTENPFPRVKRHCHNESVPTPSRLTCRCVTNVGKEVPGVCPVSGNQVRLLPWIAPSPEDDSHGPRSPHWRGSCLPPLGPHAIHTYCLAHFPPLTSLCLFPSDRQLWVLPQRVHSCAFQSSVLSTSSMSRERWAVTSKGCK